MAVSLVSNVPADRVRLNLNMVETDLAKVTQRLSTSLRIPTDEPANFAIGSLFEAQVRGFVTGGRQLQNGVSLLNVASTSLNQVADLLATLVGLATQAADGSLTNAQRSDLDAAFQATITSIDNAVSGTTFNGLSLLDGTGGTVTFQAGPETGQTASIALTSDFRSTSGSGPLAGLSGLQVDTQVNAQNALAQLPTVQQSFGASSVALTTRAAELTARADYAARAQIESLAAQTAFIGVDVAAETTRLVRDQLLQTSGAAALQAANFSSSAIINLLTASVSRSFS
jgi:flagellin